MASVTVWWQAVNLALLEMQHQSLFKDAISPGNNISELSLTCGPDQAWIDCRGVSSHHIGVLSLRTWKQCLLGVFMLKLHWVSLFYNSSKQKIDSHTTAPSGKQDLAKSYIYFCKVHSCISKPTKPSFLHGYQNDSDGCFGHESMRMTSVWTCRFFKGEGSGKEEKKKADQHRLIVCETMQAKFHWKQQRRHIPLFNWVPSYDPAVVWKHVQIQNFPVFLGCISPLRCLFDLF